MDGEKGARDDILSALRVTDDQDKRLRSGGMRAMLELHAKKAGRSVPSTHDFEPAFAIAVLRNGTDLVAPARLMGHTSLKELHRHLKQLREDL